jgi:hypothetical protein
MAGRQFSLFIGLNDQEAFENAIRESGDIVFLNSKPLSSNPDELTNSTVREPGIDPFKILIARRIDVPSIEFHPIEGRPEYIYTHDVAPVVEFSRFPNVVDGRMIRASRLYRIDKYWGADGKLVSKSPEFIDWAERLYKLAKASLTKVEQGCYAGAEALEMRKQGIAFEGLDIEMGSIKA